MTPQLLSYIIVMWRDMDTSRMTKKLIPPPELPEEELLLYGHRAAAEWLEDHGWLLHYRTLMNMVPLGTGPKIRKWGVNVVYREKDLQAWAEARWRRR